MCVRCPMVLIIIALFHCKRKLNAHRVLINFINFVFKWDILFSLFFFTSVSIENISEWNHHSYCFGVANIWMKNNFFTWISATNVEKHSQMFSSENIIFVKSCENHKKGTKLTIKKKKKCRKTSDVKFRVFIYSFSVHLEDFIQHMVAPVFFSATILSRSVLNQGYVEQCEIREFNQVNRHDSEISSLLVCI